MTDPKPATMRVDAQNNRARILDVAHDLLAASPDTSMNAIAKAAGVGAGTLYRHFPTRDALVLAVYKHDVQRLVDAAPDLLREHSAIEALRRWFARLASYIRIKHGLADALDAATKQAMTDETYAPVIATIARILAAGEADGTIRSGLDPADVLLLMSSIWRTADTSDDNAQERRLLDSITRALQP